MKNYLDDEVYSPRRSSRSEDEWWQPPLWVFIVCIACTIATTVLQCSLFNDYQAIAEANGMAMEQLPFGKHVFTALVSSFSVAFIIAALAVLTRNVYVWLSKISRNRTSKTTFKFRNNG